MKNKEEEKYKEAVLIVCYMDKSNVKIKKTIIMSTENDGVYYRVINNKEKKIVTNHKIGTIVAVPSYYDEEINGVPAILCYCFNNEEEIEKNTKKLIEWMPNYYSKF